MKRLIPLFLCLALVLGFAASEAQAAEQKAAVVHFVVVPQTLASGYDSAPVVLEFKKAVIELAGGFTELGPSRGGSVGDGMVKHEQNISFVIGADRDISMELQELADRLFDGKGVFIMSWPGKMVN